MMRQHLAILCDNKPGVLTHVAGLISRRAINIECINAGYTEEADVTRINIVVSVENRWELDQAVNQLAKLIDVIKVVNLDDAPFISYELAMIKVQSPTPQTREELTNIAQLFNAKIVDVQRRSLVLRLTGREDHIEALLEMLKDYDIIEIARTGQISPVPQRNGPSRICRERMNTMRSDVVKKGVTRNRHRTLFHAMGYSDEDLRNR